MKVIALKYHMKQGKTYRFINGLYESINEDNKRFINYDIHFKKKDWEVLSVEDMTAKLLQDIVNKKFYKATYILRVNIVNNYNGTKTIIVYYINNFKCEYLVKG